MSFFFISLKFLIPFSPNQFPHSLLQIHLIIFFSRDAIIKMVSSKRTVKKKRFFDDSGDEEEVTKTVGGARPGAGRLPWHEKFLLEQQKERERAKEMRRAQAAKREKIALLDESIDFLRPRRGQSASLAEAKSALLMLAQVQRDNLEWSYSKAVLAMYVSSLMHRGNDWLFAISKEFNDWLNNVHRPEDE